jgi:hypothetical protein
LLAPLFAAALTLTIDKSHVLARFDPSKSIGAAIDVQEHGAAGEVLTRRNVSMLSNPLNALVRDTVQPCHSGEDTSVRPRAPAPLS